MLIWAGFAICKVQQIKDKQPTAFKSAQCKLSRHILNLQSLCHFCCKMLHKSCLDASQMRFPISWCWVEFQWENIIWCINPGTSHVMSIPCSSSAKYENNVENSWLTNMKVRVSSMIFFTSSLCPHGIVCVCVYPSSMIHQYCGYTQKIPFVYMQWNACTNVDLSMSITGYICLWGLYIVHTNSLCLTGVYLLYVQ